MYEYKEMDEEHYELSNNMAESNATFPVKLFAMLLFDCGYAVDWLSHGLAFRVRDTNHFIHDIMPRYFKQTKLTSFQRQLNLYGFRRLTKGDDQGAYFHPKFQRGRRDLLSEIRRLPGKGSVPAVDYSGFEDFISHRISSGNEAPPQISYNLRTIESERSIVDYSKSSSSSLYDHDDDHDIYAKSYLRSARTSRTSPNTKPNINFTTTTTTTNYDNGNDVYNVKNSRKRQHDDALSSSSSSSYNKQSDQLTIPSSSYHTKPSAASSLTTSSSNDIYNFNNLGTQLVGSVSSMYPRSKSKITMNIGFEKIAGSGYNHHTTRRSSDSYVPSLPLRYAQLPSFSSSSSNQLPDRLANSSSSLSSTLPSSSYQQQLNSRTRSEEPSPFSFSQTSDLLGIDSSSFEEYNRRQFDQATGKVVDLDQFDFDAIFPAQPE